MRLIRSFALPGPGRIERGIRAVEARHLPIERSLGPHHGRRGDSADRPGKANLVKSRRRMTPLPQFFERDRLCATGHAITAPGKRGLEQHPRPCSDGWAIGSSRCKREIRQRPPHCPSQPSWSPGGISSLPALSTGLHRRPGATPSPERSMQASPHRPSRARACIAPFLA